jgi:hypothetical protein
VGRALLLGAVHRHVGALKQHVGVVPVLRIHRHPDRCLDRQRQVLHDHRQLERRADAVDDRQHVLAL